MDVLKRSVPATLERTDRHTLETRIMPWNVVAVAVDELPDGKVEKYHEVFYPSAFDRQLNAAAKQDGIFQRVSLVDEHHEGLGKIGFTVSARKEDDGFYGRVRLLPSKIDDVEAMLEEGVNKLSVEFFPHRGGTKYLTDGTRARTDAHLYRVALVAKGAYEGSEVLAMRDAEEMVAQVDAEYTAYVDDLDEWLASANSQQAELMAKLTTT